MLEFSCWLTDNIYKKSNGIWIIIELLVYIYICFKCETDDELVESVKCMKEISFCHSQHSTITTLNLAKYKLIKQFLL
jgi:hypothetical protein